MTVLLLSALLLPVVYGFSLFGGAEVSSDGPSIVTPDGTMHLEDMEAIVNPDYHLREKREYGYYKNWGSFPNLLVSSEPPSNWHQRWLTYEHNRYRRMVPASDMRLLYWSDELARSAQRHADRCDFRHSRDRVNVGENIWAAPYSNYSEAISIWFAEVHNPWCGCQHAYKHCCGHYVQVVWAKTSLVGCGFARCQDVWGVQGRGHRNVFVCHYNPQGNTVYVTGNGQLYAVPAFTWATGEKGRCSDCPKEAPACFQGLCYMPANSTETTQSARSTASTMAPTTTATTPATTTRNRWADEKRTTTNPRWIFNEQLRRWEKNTSFNNDEPSSNRWQNTNNVNDFRRWRH